jgi:hypothetical protein
MRTNQTNDSKHWRERAAQIRDIAIKIQGTEAAILMGDFANDYDKFADNNERQTTKKISPSRPPQLAASLRRLYRSASVRS